MTQEKLDVYVWALFFTLDVAIIGFCAVSIVRSTDLFQQVIWVALGGGVGYFEVGDDVKYLRAALKNLKHDGR